MCVLHIADDGGGCVDLAYLFDRKRDHEERSTRASVLFGTSMPISPSSKCSGKERGISLPAFSIQRPAAAPPRRRKPRRRRGTSSPLRRGESGRKEKRWCQSAWMPRPALSKARPPLASRAVRTRGVTLKLTRGSVRARRQRPSEECRTSNAAPVKSINGKTVTSVAPRLDAARESSSDVGVRQLHVAESTTTSGPAIVWIKSAIERSMLFASFLTNPWSTMRIPFICAKWRDGSPQTSVRLRRARFRGARSAGRGRRRLRRSGSCRARRSW